MGRGFRKSLARMAARVVWVEDGGLLTLVLDSEITALRQVRHAVSDADIRAFPQACATVVGFWSSADILRRSHPLLRFASIVRLRSGRSGEPDAPARLIGGQ
ncbi:RpiR family transcriptional regulator (fragment) (plasmid) [Agrobacterium pusense]|uniref:RpiR family transcriptional regulator n=2 Tax=Agrobacterium pusense TaxID=648995 RepID=U4QFD6_9HYPH